MSTSSMLLLALVGSAAAFTSNVPVFHRPSVNSRSSLCMGGATGFATSLDGKKEKVDNVKGLLESSEMVFSVPASSLSVAEVQGLRRSLPEGTTMSVVKNKLFNRASEGTPYEAANEGGLLKGANMWFFIEEDIAGSVKAFNAFQKECGKEESHMILGGVIDGQCVDTDDVKRISKLPSKLDLIAKIAAGVNAVPTKVARVIKAPSSKLARAIKLATDADEEA